MTASSRAPRRAVATRHQPAPAVNPVLTPEAPGYSHSITLRFWIRRGGDLSPTGRPRPCWRRGAGRRRTLAPRRAGAAGRRRTTRPRSSRPCGDANLVRDIPSARARAFIASTNAPTLPASSIASASAASFAEPSRSPASRSTHRDPLARPEPERGARPVVARDRTRRRDRPGRCGRAAPLLLPGRGARSSASSGSRPAAPRPATPGTGSARSRGRPAAPPAASTRGTGSGSTGIERSGDERRGRPVGRDRRGRRRGARHDREQARPTAGRRTNRMRRGRRATAHGGDPPPHALRRWSRRLVRSRACLNFRDVVDRFARVCAAVRRASGFF